MKECQSFEEEYGVKDPDLVQLAYAAKYPQLYNLDYREFKVQIAPQYQDLQTRTINACCREHARDMFNNVISVSLD